MSQGAKLVFPGSQQLRCQAGPRDGTVSGTDKPPGES